MRPAARWLGPCLVALALAPGALAPGAMALPVITELSDDVVPCNGYLEVRGSGFGETMGALLIDGAPAPVASWSDVEVVGYVPEGTPTAAVEVRIVAGAEQSDPAALTVATCEPFAPRIAWRQRFDALYSHANPEIGPDGTIYVLDVQYRLHAVSPSGHVKWIVDGFFPSEPDAPVLGNTSVDVAAGGMIYSARAWAVSALKPDGSLLWRRDHATDERSYIVYDTKVGPDGNVYVAASHTTPDGLGIYSLTPDGELRWNVPHPYDRSTRKQIELVFGPGPFGPQLYFSANQNSYALTLADGDVVFDNILQVTGFTAVSPVDGTVHSTNYAYSPEGDILWQAPMFLNGWMTMDSFGAHYCTASLVTKRVIALDTDGSVIFETPIDLPSSTTPEVTTVTPDDALLIHTDIAHRMLVLSAATGEEEWRMELGPEEVSPSRPQGFSQYWTGRPAFDSAHCGPDMFHLAALNTGGATRDRTFLYAMTLNDSSITPVDIGASLRVAGSTLSWETAPSSPCYDVARGVISQLHRERDVGSAGSLSCRQAEKSLVDPEVPFSDGLYYLVRAHGGTWGSPERDAALTACP